MMLSSWDVLIDLIHKNSFTKIAEIGVRYGNTARRILSHCNLEKYLLVDPVKYDIIGNYVSTKPEVDYWIMRSDEAAPLVLDKSFDLIYIDALHDYDHVLEDIRLWQPKIREGGILCGDDYEQHNAVRVKPAVEEIFGDKVKLVPVGVKECKIWIVQIKGDMLS